MRCYQMLWAEKAEKHYRQYSTAWLACWQAFLAEFTVALAWKRCTSLTKTLQPQWEQSRQSTISTEGGVKLTSVAPSGIGSRQTPLSTTSTLIQSSSVGGRVDQCAAGPWRTARSPKSEASTCTTRCPEGASLVAPWVSLVTSESPPAYLVYGPECPKPITQNCEPSPTRWTDTTYATAN